MTQRLFQDAGGTTPAIIAGQPVGLIKRLAGSVDATQATALSKPTLARWPRTGRRNLANINTFEPIAVGRTTNYDSGGLQVGLSRDGITGTVVAKGEDGGIPYIDVHYTGTSTAAATVFFNLGASNIIPVAEGQDFVASAFAGVVAGSLPAADTFVCFINFSPTPAQSVAMPIPNDGAFIRRVRTAVVAEGKNVFSSGGVYVKIQPGQAVDFTVRVGGVQIERGLSTTSLQLARSVNDITEQGVADLWHLYNDGGDSLNVTLPAGTYGLASIDINHAITIATITSDGTTPINTLRHERQLDVILRAGAFSAGEETAIRDYWGRVFA